MVRRLPGVVFNDQVIERLRPRRNYAAGPAPPTRVRCALQPAREFIHARFGPGRAPASRRRGAPPRSLRAVPLVHWAPLSSGRTTRRKDHSVLSPGSTWHSGRGRLPESCVFPLGRHGTKGRSAPKRRFASSPLPNSNSPRVAGDPASGPPRRRTLRPAFPSPPSVVPEVAGPGGEISLLIMGRGAPSPHVRVPSTFNGRQRRGLRLARPRARATCWRWTARASQRVNHRRPPESLLRIEIAGRRKCRASAGSPPTPRKSPAARGSLQIRYPPCTFRAPPLDRGRPCGWPLCARDPFDEPEAAHPRPGQAAVLLNYDPRPWWLGGGPFISSWEERMTTPKACRPSRPRSSGVAQAARAAGKTRGSWHCCFAGLFSAYGPPRLRPWWRSARTTNHPTEISATLGPPPLSRSQPLGIGPRPCLSRPTFVKSSEV